MAEEWVFTKDELPQVTKLSATTIEEEIRQGRFPAPVELSPRRVGWLAREIWEWLGNRPRSSQLPPPNTGVKKPRTQPPTVRASRQGA